MRVVLTHSVIQCWRAGVHAQHDAPQLHPQGKVILVESKKERKAKAAMALKDFQSKLSAERSKHSSSGVSSTTTSASSSPAKPAAPSPEVAAASAKPAPASPQKKKVSRVQVTAEVHAEAHTATFSTAPAPKRENSRDKLSSSRESASPRLSQAPLDDPFATGGDADNAHSDEEGDGDGDISGDITNQHIEDTSSEDEPPDEDDFAAMLAAADDLQAS